VQWQTEFTDVVQRVKSAIAKIMDNTTRWNLETVDSNKIPTRAKRNCEVAYLVTPWSVPLAEGHKLLNHVEQGLFPVLEEILPGTRARATKSLRPQETTTVHPGPYVLQVRQEEQLPETGDFVNCSV
jgi:hypothetical protein